FLTPELQRFLLIVHMVHSHDVVNLPAEQDAEPVRRHLRRPFTETDGKSKIGFRHRQSGGSLFLPALSADRGMAGIIILPDILPVPNRIRHHGILLEGHFNIQKSDLHQNASFRLPKSSARSVRFRAWWSAS